MGYWDNDCPFESIKGKTLSAVYVESDTVRFVVDENESYVLYHSQDCCENVYVESVVGDVNDLTGSPLLMVEEVSNADWEAPEYADSYTWTFYKLATIHGSVTIRFLGTSNGYYSEGVSFRKE